MSTACPYFMYWIWCFSESYKSNLRVVDSGDLNCFQNLFRHSNRETHHTDRWKIPSPQHQYLWFCQAYNPGANMGPMINLQKIFLLISIVFPVFPLWITDRKSFDFSFPPRRCFRHFMVLYDLTDFRINSGYVFALSSFKESLSRIVPAVSCQIERCPVNRQDNSSLQSHMCLHRFFGKKMRIMP